MSDHNISLTVQYTAPVEAAATIVLKSEVADAVSDHVATADPLPLGVRSQTVFGFDVDAGATEPTPIAQQAIMTADPSSVRVMEDSAFCDDVLVGVPAIEATHDPTGSVQLCRTVPVRVSISSRKASRVPELARADVPLPKRYAIMDVARGVVATCRAQCRGCSCGRRSCRRESGRWCDRRRD